MALTTTCEKEDVKEKDTNWKGGPFKITFPEEAIHYGPDRCKSNCSWNGTESWIRNCIPVVGCTICNNKLTKLLLSNPAKCDLQWKLEPRIEQTIDETLSNLRRRRIQVLRTRKVRDSNTSLYNDIARCQKRAKFKDRHKKKEGKK